MTIKPHNAERLKNRMVELYGSVRQFAIRSGIERTQIYPILRGAALPGLAVFVTLAARLGYSLAELADILDVQPRKESDR